MNNETPLHPSSHEPDSLGIIARAPKLRVPEVCMLFYINWNSVVYLPLNPYAGSERNATYLEVFEGDLAVLIDYSDQSTAVTTTKEL